MASSRSAAPHPHRVESSFLACHVFSRKNGIGLRLLPLFTDAPCGARRTSPCDCSILPSAQGVVRQAAFCTLTIARMDASTYLRHAQRCNRCRVAFAVQASLLVVATADCGWSSTIRKPRCTSSYRRSTRPSPSSDRQRRVSEHRECALAVSCRGLVVAASQAHHPRAGRDRSGCAGMTSLRGSPLK
jgi:hypothetical protein